MQLTGFSIRNGCCDYFCCCDDSGKIYDVECCCMLYSFTLEGSQDNRTWTAIHKEERVKDFYACESKTYEFSKTVEYKYVRIIQDEPYPGCMTCMQINQVELYGTAVDRMLIDDMEDNDESVSIIGKVNRNIVD